MKRVTLLLALCFAALANQAQITLSNSDWPSVGLTIEAHIIEGDSTLNLTDTFDLGSAGASGVYDFSAAEPIGGVLRTINYVDPATLPEGASHTTANIGYFDEYFESEDSNGNITDTTGEIYVFGTTSATDYREVGLTFVMDTVALFTDGDSSSGIWDTFTVTHSAAEVWATSSYAFGHTATENSSWTVQVGSLNHTESSTKNIDVDGEGVLTSARGTFDVIRVKYEVFETSMDSMAGDSAADIRIDTIHYFQYWAQGFGFPLAFAMTNAAGDETWFVQTVWANPVGIKDPKSEELSVTVAPNPVKHQMDVRFKDYQNKNIAVINAIGQELMSVDMTSSRMQLSTQDLRDGMYFVVVRDRTGNVAVQKVLIAK